MTTWMRSCGSPILWGIPLALLALAPPLPAQNLGMVVDNDGSPLVCVFDADLDQVIGQLALPASTGWDCEMLESQNLGFVAGWDGGVHVISLVDPFNPTLLTSISTSSVVENVTITRDQQWLIACDGGGGTAPVSVINISTLTETFVYADGEDHSSVAVCDSGSVLTTGWGSGNLRRLEIDGFGNLTNTFEVRSYINTLYSAFSPTCNYAVVHYSSSGGAAATMESVSTNGLSTVDSRPLSSWVICSLMHPSANLYYVRTIGHLGGTSAIEQWEYDHSTGTFAGTTPLNTYLLGDIAYDFGIEQMVLHPDGDKLYAIDDDNDRVHVLNATTLTWMADLAGLPTSFNNLAGICVRTTSEPLAVDLEYLRARRESGSQIQINWGTASELENAGFKIYRQPWSATPTAVPTDSAVLVNPTLIPARGAPFQATSYRWVDRNVLPGEAYHYWLIDIDIHGESTTHGPIAVR